MAKNTIYKIKKLNIKPYLSIFKNLSKIKIIAKSKNMRKIIPPTLKIKNVLFDLFME